MEAKLAFEDKLKGLVKTKQRRERAWKVLVPRPDVEEVIRKFHQEMGYFGIKKTWQHLRRYFYWKGIKMDVRDYVNRTVRDVCKPNQTCGEYDVRTSISQRNDHCSWYQST